MTKQVSRSTVKQVRTNWANALTWSRLVLYVPITIAAYFDQRILAGVLFAVGQLTDVLDGYVARKAGVAGEAGARFDSQVDTLAIPLLFVWFWFLFPQLLRDSALMLAVVVPLLLVQLVLVKRNLGIWSGLHLWTDKLTAITASISVILLFALGDLPWTRTLWFIALIISVLAFTEGIVYVLRGGKNIDARWFGDA